MAKTIKIFLIDGEPNGLKTAELSNWVGQAMVIPRNKLKETKARPECRKPAVYFLIGKESEEALLPSVYIGEAGDSWDRLSTHDSSKDFWQTAVVFTSNNLTKAHVKYLESRCLTIANQVKRFNLENDADSSLPFLPEADTAEMEEFLGNLIILLSALGYPILQEVISKEQKDSSNPLFICKGKEAVATGRMTNDGFVVYKDSTATTNFSKAVTERNQRFFEKLLTTGYVKKKSEELYVFIKDYVFNSPSAASDTILGNSTSGWKKWKAKNNKTLEEVYKNQ
jgi:hypothetical protein